MRTLLTRGIAPAAERGCDECGIIAHKGQSNSTKYTGYIAPCDVELRTKEGTAWGPARGYASGKVVKGSGRRPIHEVEPVTTHFLTAVQVERRDTDVEKAVEQIKQGNKRNPSKAEAEIEKLAMQVGTRGQSEFARSGLHYWDATTCHPVAVYHTTLLGPGKDLIRWLNIRLGVGEKPKGELLVPISPQGPLRSLLCTRLLHFVLRNKPDCIMVDFTAHVGRMTISEMQLLYEVGVPYLVHDLPAFGVHRAIPVMLLLLRHGMLCFTRLMGHTKDQYRTQLKMGQCCLFAYGAIAEYLHTKDRDREEGLSQFNFTWKLHKLQHIADQLLARGFTIWSSDMWVERSMRSKASVIIKCVNPVSCMSHICVQICF
jgi:hypothetical protein